jgi:hypothetical protein
MSKTSQLFTLGAYGALLGFTLLLGAPAFGADPAVAKIAAAKTKADHEELAALYEREAKEAAAKSEDHSQRAEKYRKTPGFGPGRDLARHCDYIADKYKETAGESQTMAKMHRDLAASAMR